MTTDWANAQYELRVDYAPDEDGDYHAYVYVDGRMEKCKLGPTREHAILAAREWAAWRRATQDGHEIIPL